MNKILAAILFGALVMTSIILAMYFSHVQNGWGFIAGYVLSSATAACLISLTLGKV